MLTERLPLLPQTLKDFAPCARASDRATWHKLPQETRARLVSRGEACLHKPFLALTASDWLLFSQTGDRAQFEARYFARRRQLNDLVMAECVEYQGRFVPDLVDGIWALCEESAWQLPAHNNYIRDTPPLALPDVTRPVLDLFACETGALLAVAHFLLEDLLRELSPLLVARVEQTLAARIVKPYLDAHFWWMGNGDEPMCNWTSWCTQNVLLVLFCTPQSDQMRRAGLCRAAASLDCFLKDYGIDGCCNEGAQYYSHAGLTLWGALEVLDAVAPEAFSPLWQEEKIRNLAAYIFHMHVNDAYYINFADCSPLAGRRGAREFLFALRTGNADMAAFCAADWHAAQSEPDLNHDIARINLFYLCVEAFCAEQLMRLSVPAHIPHQEVYYPSVGVFIARDDRYTLAVKAGGNGDSHNHNDTGSITLYKYGMPLLIDVGVETYTRKTFSPERYEIWSMQSAWHNLPDFDGVTQKDGADFCATDVKIQFDVDASRIAMQLAGAYPAQAGVTSYRRTVTLEKGARIYVEEHCEGNYRQAVLSLLFCALPKWDGTALTSAAGRLTFQGVKNAPKIEAIPISDARLRLAWPDTLYRVRIAFDRALFWTIE